MNILLGKNITVKISIFIVWIFHVCGLIGITYGNKDWFIAFTPVNLFLSFFLLFVTQNELNNKNIISALSIFLIGMIAEILGVNFGIIFGEYEYLDNLGIKIFGVPIIIGVQWILLTFITGSFSAYIFKKSKIKADPLKFINKLIKDFKIKIPSQLPSMASMLVGYFSYDVIRYIEKIPNNCKDDLNIPDVRLSRPNNLVVYDLSLIHI